jgi:hypothetical protein
VNFLEDFAMLALKLLDPLKPDSKVGAASISGGPTGAGC